MSVPDTPTPWWHFWYWLKFWGSWLMGAAAEQNRIEDYRKGKIDDWRLPRD